MQAIKKKIDYPVVMLWLGNGKSAPLVKLQARQSGSHFLVKKSSLQICSLSPVVTNGNLVLLAQ